MPVPYAEQSAAPDFIFENGVLALRFPGERQRRKPASLLRRNICRD
jgi:hypothetical protein